MVHNSHQYIYCNYYKQQQKGEKPKSSISGDKMFGMYLSNFTRGNDKFADNHNGDQEKTQDASRRKEH